MIIKKGITLASIMLLLISSNVFANDTLNIYYSKIDEVGNNYMKHMEVDFVGTYQDKIDVMLNVLFENPIADMDYKLKDVLVLDYILVDNELIINVTDDIKKYASSNQALNIRNQIVETTTSLEEVDTVTVCVEGKLSDIGGMYIYKDK